MNLTNALRRFESKIAYCPMSGCWLWAEGLLTGGYGQFWLAGHTRRAHQVAWELFVGPIPLGLGVLHRCDVRSCVNPQHLFLGTNADNVADMVRKQRQRGARGERGGASKLCESDVLAILTDPRTHAAIAVAYGVSRSNISYIKKRTSWAYV